MSEPQYYIGKDVELGSNVKIWHYAYVGDGAKLGDNVSVGSLAHVDFNVRVGSNSRIGGSVYIPPLTVIGENVFIGPGATITNDPYPMSERMIGVVIEDGAIIGGGAVIKAGVCVGRESVVGMGAVVVKDVPPGMVVAGNPARVLYERAVFDKKKRDWESKSL
jgi:acetyltransferase-like isoleucine patch superfamily enzyme